MRKITTTTLWLPKRLNYQTYNCSACISYLQIIWEPQWHRWHFCRLVKGVWYSRSCNFLKKFEIYGIAITNRAWFRSYLTNRKEYISINSRNKTFEQNITCGVRQGSILGLNDLQSASSLLNTIFGDNTNLVVEHKDIRVLLYNHQ